MGCWKDYGRAPFGRRRLLELASCENLINTNKRCCFVTYVWWYIILYSRSLEMFLVLTGWTQTMLDSQTVLAVSTPFRAPHASSATQPSVCAARSAAGVAAGACGRPASVAAIQKAIQTQHSGWSAFEPKLSAFAQSTFLGSPRPTQRAACHLSRRIHVLYFERSERLSVPVIVYSSDYNYKYLEPYQPKIVNLFVLLDPAIRQLAFVAASPSRPHYRMTADRNNSTARDEHESEEPAPGKLPRNQAIGIACRVHVRVM